MAFNYFQSTYPYYNPQAMSNPYSPQNLMQTAQNQNIGLIWVQGESGAKSYMTPPGSTVLLLDSERQRFYVKSSDASGMPKPLKVYDYTEVIEAKPIEPPQLEADYVTKSEFEQFKLQLEMLLKEGAQNG